MNTPCGKFAEQSELKPAGSKLIRAPMPVLGIPASIPVFILVVFVLAGLIPTTSFAQGNVTIESKTVRQGDTGVCLGVYILNTSDIYGVVLPFEIRTVSGGAYIANRFRGTPSGRIAASDLMDEVFERFGGTRATAVYCWGYLAYSPMDFVSPDGYMWAAVTHHDLFPQGSDGMVGEGTPSFVFHFDVNELEGEFEIDTCCFGPANHIGLVDYGPPIWTPQFRKSVVTVSRACSCPCQADPVCDSVADVLDVLSSVDQSFNHLLLLQDAGCRLLSRADLNCDCVMNVVDVVMMVGRVFRGLEGQVCNPCETGVICCPHCQ